jgi:hypothetical protein
VDVVGLEEKDIKNLISQINLRQIKQDLGLKEYQQTSLMVTAELRNLIP